VCKALGNKKGAFMELSDDGKSIKLSINKELSAIELETLISDLSEMRANMLPAVPMERPKPGSEYLSERILAQDEPSIEAKLLNDGRIRFWLRNHGLGWLVFNFTINQAITLREFLISNTPDTDGRPSLFGNEGGEGNAH